MIVPVFNVAGHVGACLESLKAQSLTDFEAIVIDDGSTDESRAVAAGVIAGDPRFRLVATGNAGLSNARNLGLSMARGDVLGFLDGDDRYAPDFLGRMLAAMETAGTDWVACALNYVVEDQPGERPHSARHSAPVPLPGRGATLCDLTDWRAVVDHFPSAWNKLYRRGLIAGLRFDPGAVFEDHAFFWQVAARTGTLLHLPETLYLQTQGRPGQITRTGGEEVFRQFEVLERLEALLPGLAGRSHRDAAFKTLAVRLIFERGQVIGDAQRKARFVAAAKDWMAARGIDWRRDGPEPQRPGRFARALTGRKLLSVVVPTDGAAEPLAETLQSLSHEDRDEVEVIVVTDGSLAAGALAPRVSALATGAAVLTAGPVTGAATGVEAAAARVAAARNRGLAAASSEVVVFLDAGDLALPGALGSAAAALAEEAADFAFAGFRFNRADGPVHGGVHDEGPFQGGLPMAGPLDLSAALALHALPGSKLFRRRFLEDRGLGFAPHVLQSWALVLQASLAAGRIGRRGAPSVILADRLATRGFWRAPVAAATLAAAVDRTAAALGPGALGAAGAQRLLTRAIWEKTYFATPDRDPTRPDAFLAEARRLWAARSLRVSGGQVFDPYMAPAFRAFLQGLSDRT